jgi:hypothetical protein
MDNVDQVNHHNQVHDLIRILNQYFFVINVLIVSKYFHTQVHKSDNGSDHPTESYRIPGDGFALDSVGKISVTCCKFYERCF